MSITVSNQCLEVVRHHDQNIKRNNEHVCLYQSGDHIPVQTDWVKINICNIKPKG